MTKYMHFTINKKFDYLCYWKEKDAWNSFSASLFFAHARVDELVEAIKERHSGIFFDFTEISWSKKNNAVYIEVGSECDPDREFDYDVFVMRFDHFKTMVEKWFELEKKRAENIYFIEQEDGSVAVQESLDS